MPAGAGQKQSEPQRTAGHGLPRWLHRARFWTLCRGCKAQRRRHGECGGPPWGCAAARTGGFTCEHPKVTWGARVRRGLGTCALGGGVRPAASFLLPAAPWRLEIWKGLSCRPLHPPASSSSFGLTVWRFLFLFAFLLAQELEEWRIPGCSAGRPDPTGARLQAAKCAPGTNAPTRGSVQGEPGQSSAPLLGFSLPLPGPPPAPFLVFPKVAAELSG